MSDKIVGNIKLMEHIIHVMYFELPTEQHIVGSEFFELDLALLSSRHGMKHKRVK